MLCWDQPFWSAGLVVFGFYWEKDFLLVLAHWCQELTKPTENQTTQLCWSKMEHGQTDSESKQSNVVKKVGLNKTQIMSQTLDIIFLLSRQLKCLMMIYWELNNLDSLISKLPSAFTSKCTFHICTSNVNHDTMQKNSAFSASDLLLSHLSCGTGVNINFLFSALKLQCVRFVSIMASLHS